MRICYLLQKRGACVCPSRVISAQPLTLLVLPPCPVAYAAAIQHQTASTACL